MQTMNTKTKKRNLPRRRERNTPPSMCGWRPARRPHPPPPWHRTTPTATSFARSVCITPLASARRRGQWWPGSVVRERLGDTKGYRQACPRSACAGRNRHDIVRPRNSRQGATAVHGADAMDTDADARTVRVPHHGASEPYREGTLYGAAGEHAQGDEVHGAPCGQVPQVHVGSHVTLGPRLRLLDGQQLTSAAQRETGAVQAGPRGSCVRDSSACAAFTNVTDTALTSGPFPSLLAHAHSILLPKEDGSCSS